MKYSHIIWDFNGTILDDLKLSLESINTVLARRNIKQIASEDEYRNLFCFPIETYYTKLGFDFDSEPYKIPADEWIELYNNGIDDIPLTYGVIDVIKTINANNIPQIVLSASEKNTLLRQLNKYDLVKYFECVLGTDDAYGKGKVDMARDWGRTSHVDFSKSVLIGDTDHDFETAQALGCNCILYCKGHMNQERLSRFGVPVISEIKELLNLL